MKKLIYSVFIFVLGVNLVFAKPVSIKTAQTVAENFYKVNARTAVSTATLVYTQFSDIGSPLYFVFNINSNEGFVIVTADDVVKPVIGYSNEGSFVIPEKGTTVGNWLAQRKQEMTFVLGKSPIENQNITKQWSDYLNYNSSKRSIGNSTSSVAAPLVKTTWNQSPLYNALCPGASVTGCVATAMAQIMRYWKYPATGTGSSSYCDCSPNFSQNYGTLAANYGATAYNWNNMPLAITSANNDVAVLNYQCGVSVEMDYAPSGSGAWVCASDNPVCAQNAYVNYFNYDPTTIQGLTRDNYPDSVWIGLLKADIDLGRPIQYVGYEANWAGGHTWVCDGYDQNNFFHMNWGWGGSGNGYYDINNLNPSYVFPLGHQAVTGIIPIASSAVDAGIPTVSAPVGFYCSDNFSPTLTLQNYGGNTLTSCVINYQIDGGTPQTLNWNGSLVFGQITSIALPSFTAAHGTHTLVCYSSNPNGSADGNSLNDQSANIFNVTLPTTVFPVVEGFEANILPSADWDIMHSTTGNDWTVTSNTSATGIKSAMVDNSTNVGGNKSILQTSASYDIASYSAPALSFKLAYQQKTSTTNDRLQVYVSIDCGASWQSRWARWSSTLPTVSGTSNGFVPTPSEFTTYTVGLNSPVLQSHHVLFRWEYTADVNGPGNNIYIDDINITNVTTSGIQALESNVNLNVYPNPSSGLVNVDFNLSEKHAISLTVTDVLGRTIETINTKTYQPGEASLTIGAKNYQSGVYVVNINIDGQIITKKVLIN